MSASSASLSSSCCTSSPDSSSSLSSPDSETAPKPDEFCSTTKSGVTRIVRRSVFLSPEQRPLISTEMSDDPQTTPTTSLVPEATVPEESVRLVNELKPFPNSGLSAGGGGSGGGVTKSVSCNAEWCFTGSESHDTNQCRTKMMLSASSASLFKTKNYLQIASKNLLGAGDSPRHSQIQLDAGFDPEREHWDKKIEFLLAVIGFAVDLGNVWRFPYVCYRNGGGAFLVAYCIMLLFGGLPLFYLELALGQYYSSGCLTIWQRLCPIMKGLGYAICVIDIYMAMYYNTIISWSLYYLYVSFRSLVTMSLPWQSCNHSWNSERCQTLEQRANFRAHSNGSALSNASSSLDDFNNPTSPAEEYFLNEVLNIDVSSGIDSLGSIQSSLAICLMIVFLVVYFALWKGVKSTGKAVWVTALMPYFVIFVFLIRATTLDGASDGIRYYLEPDWNKLYGVTVWIDAATQIFFSLGPGFGTLMTLASYNHFHNNCYRDAIITSSVNCLTSFIAGFVTFSILGFMSKKLNREISTVVADGPGLVFIVYPEVIGTMYGSVFFSILFFVMLITLGLDSTFGGLEALITGLCDNYPKLLRRNRKIFVAVLIAFIYLCSLPTTTYGGNYLINLLDRHGTSLPLLFVVFIETIAICWFYGSEKFSHQIKEMLGSKPGLFWRICWRFLSPIFLGAISVASLLELGPLTLNGYSYPRWSVYVGWAITLSSLLCIPVYAVYHFIITPGDTFEQRFANAYRPPLIVNTREFRPNGSAVVAGSGNTSVGVSCRKKIAGQTPMGANTGIATTLTNDSLPVVCLIESAPQGAGERV